MKKNNILIFYIVSIFLGCTINTEIDSFFADKFPGKPNISISNDEIVISNNAIRASWKLEVNSIVLSEVENGYDGEVINLESVTLFAVELVGGSQLTNRDFKLQGQLKIIDIQNIDSLPKKSLRFPGKEISGLFIEKENGISIRWIAQLREGSNYIRQNIEISVIENPVKISKVIFFEGTLGGAKYAGSVIGSPIEYENFFFGFEHPIAQSSALLARNIGSITQSTIDVSDIIDAPGEYILSVEHGGGPAGFNINSVSMLENDKMISFDRHSLNGIGGDSFYHLNIDYYNPENKYQIQPEIENIANTTGTFHIIRKTDDLLNFYVDREDELQPGESISEWSVIGVSPENQNRRAFLYYLERERARPYKQFLHYNCWWDITDDGASSFTSEQLIERMHAWNDKFIEPYDIKLNSFVFDDGWDNLDSVWYFDPVKFPDGFEPQAELCKKYNSGIGVWMSPFGGYVDNKKRRVESAHREGLETNDKGLSLAGTNYYNRFLERSLDMLNNYNVNYFKFDGFGGSNPKYLPDMEAGAKLIKELRKYNPEVFINITVGSWPSPFWLQYADCTWRGSGDLHQAGQGSLTQKFITYSDGTLYNNIVKRAPYYPLNSIMTVGIAYANLGHPKNFINDDIEDFNDMVWSFFGAGSSLQELYISHDRMKPDFWPILAEAAKWAKENENVLIDTHWIGGSPINLEVYGFASWVPGKGIITLRNPRNNRIEYNLNLNRELELPDEHKQYYFLKSLIGEDSSQKEIRVESKSEFTITLEAYETKVFEAIPN